MMPRPRIRKDRWTSMVAHSLHAFRLGAVLSVTLIQDDTDEQWKLIAVETDAVDKPTPAAVLDSHAHEWLGEFSTEKKARAAALQYAAKWKKQKTPKKKCGCDEIKPGLLESGGLGFDRSTWPSRQRTGASSQARSAKRAR